MVAIKDQVQPSVQQEAYKKAYQRYADLNRCLGPYFRASYSA